MPLTRRNSEEERYEEQQARQMDQQNMSLAAAQPDDHQIDPDLIRELTTTDLNQGTVDTLANMLSKDWVLSNLSEAEVHETRWLARVMMDQLEALHPHEDSIWTGEWRRYASGEDRQVLEPLDPAQRLVTFELIQTVISRAARSRDGWQQETMQKSIVQSIRDAANESDDGGWL